MKPIGAYSLGIEYNYITYSDSFLDSPFKPIMDQGKLRDWPNNYSKTYTDTGMLVVDALANSINTVAVRVGNLVGPDTMF